jgi:hypothetical protein
MRVQVLKGSLICRIASFRALGRTTTASLNGTALPQKASFSAGLARVEFDQPITIREGNELSVEVRA